MEKYAQGKILFRDTKWLLSNMSYKGRDDQAVLSLRSRPYNMATPLSTCTVEEQRSVVRFLWSECVKPSEIYRRMKVQYGDSCLSQGRVYELVERFQNGRQNVSDEHRSGRPVSVASEWNSRSSFFLEGIRKLVDRWTKCVAKQVDYVKK